MNKLNKKRYIKYTSLSVLFIFMGILLNFPFSILIHNYTEKFLNNPNCPLLFKSKKINFFPPGLTLSKILIPSSCSKNSISDLHLKELTISLNGPSIFPPGIRISSTASMKKTRLKIENLITFSGLKLRITKTQIDSNLINKLIHQNDLLKGYFNLKSLISIKGNLPESGNFKLTSKNFGIRNKNIMGFEIPPINFGKAILTGSIESKKIMNILEFSLGNMRSPIILRLKGNINFNSFNFLFSKLDLKGEIKFSPNFLKKMSILNLILNGKKKSNGYYTLKIKGSIANPRPQIL